MRKIADRLTKNGKRRGRRPRYLTTDQIEAPLGKLRPRNRPRRKPASTTLLIVQREVAKRGATNHTKKELASLTAARAAGSKRKATAAFMATIERRLRRIDASVGINRL